MLVQQFHVVAIGAGRPPEADIPRRLCQGDGDARGAAGVARVEEMGAASAKSGTGARSSILVGRRDIGISACCDGIGADGPGARGLCSRGLAVESLYRVVLSVGRRPRQGAIWNGGIPGRIERRLGEVKRQLAGLDATGTESGKAGDGKGAAKTKIYSQH
ncbi:hypothetical protein D3C72_1451180 [compost metagenome]